MYVKLALKYHATNNLFKNIRNEVTGEYSSLHDPDTNITYRTCIYTLVKFSII